MAQQVQLLGGLGVIPSWQFSSDPAVNLNINPHVQFPEGMNQMTVQPVGNWPTSGDVNLQGLGRSSWFTTKQDTFLSRLARRGTASARRDCAGLCPGNIPPAGPNCTCPDPSMLTSRQFRGLGTPITTFLKPAVGVPGQGVSGVFDSGWWQNRKWLALGIFGALGAGAAALAFKVLK